MLQNINSFVHSLKIFSLKRNLGYSQLATTTGKGTDISIQIFLKYVL